MNEAEIRAMVERLGGAAKVSKDLGYTRQAVCQWFKREAIPETAAWRLVHVYGCLVNRDELGLPMLASAAA